MKKGLCLTVSLLACSVLYAKPLVYFSNAGGIQKHLVEAINRATLSVDVAVYEMTAAPLIDALKQAGRRGVQVRIVTDGETLHEHPQARALAGLVNISMRSVGGRDKHRGMMHNKFAIFDETRFVTGSYNWSQGAEFANYENVVFEDDMDALRAYSAQFADLWSRGKPVDPGFASGKNGMPRSSSKNKKKK